jgi:TatD family-associated radical SAM protein
MDTYVYRLHNGLYVNLTNACNNDCEFCERRRRSGVGPYCLWLEQEPSAQQVVEEIARQITPEVEEVVFCGYGEPTLRLEALVEVARQVKERFALPVRINTNGLANLHYGRDITPMLKGCVDTVSISLNASTESEYDALCHPTFGIVAYMGLLDFARKAATQVPHVVLTVVDVIGAKEVEACRKIAQENGVDFRVRPMEAL